MLVLRIKNSLINLVLNVRLIELNKLKISTRKHEAELLVKNNGNDPDVTEENAAKSLGGVIVKTFQVSVPSI